MCNPTTTRAKNRRSSGISGHSKCNPAQMQTPMQWVQNMPYNSNAQPFGIPNRMMTSNMQGNFMAMPQQFRTGVQPQVYRTTN